MTNLKHLYKQIWEEREHVCKVCGYWIPKPVSHVFSHVYTKGAHPALKLVKLNIQLWCSTIIRADGKIGCHEAHHRKPSVFKRRAKENGYEKPNLLELYANTNHKLHKEITLWKS